MAQSLNEINTYTSNTTNLSFPAEHLRTESAGTKYFTTAKIQRVALYTLAALCIAGAVTLIGVSIAGVITWPLVFLSIPLFAAAGGAITLALRIKDYENPIELQKFKEEAHRLNYQELVDKHGLPHIQKYALLPKEKLQEKFGVHIQGKTLGDVLRLIPLFKIVKFELVPLEKMQTLFKEHFQTLPVTQFFNTFQIEQLRQYNIISQALYQELSQMGQELHTHQQALNGQEQMLDLRYPNRKEKLLERLNQQERAARRQAQEQIEAARSVGRSATEVAVAFQKRDPDKEFWGNWKEQMRVRGQGYAITELAAMGMSALTESQLQQTLAWIAVERERIERDSYAAQEQLSYLQHMQQARGAFDAKVQALEARFNALKRKR